MEWRKIIETDDIVEVISRSDVKNVMCSAFMGCWDEKETKRSN